MLHSIAYELMEEPKCQEEIRSLYVTSIRIQIICEPKTQVKTRLKQIVGHESSYNMPVIGHNSGTQISNAEAGTNSPPFFHSTDWRVCGWGRVAYEKEGMIFPEPQN